MPDVLLFGATGFTGKLTAQALADRGVSFAISGRNRDKLEALAEETGGPEIRVASAGDTEALTEALEGTRVLITCVGPFIELGETAAEAAVKAGVHYIDSTGEQAFVAQLIDKLDDRARRAGIAMAPAMGFDEVPADVAATMATEDMERPKLVMSYSLPSQGSVGTAKSAIDIITRKGPWIVAGKQELVSAGERERWSPMPPPLGPRRAVSFPLAEGRLAPLHLDLEGLELYVTLGEAQRIGLKGLPLLRALMTISLTRSAIEGLVGRLTNPPEGAGRNARWTILAEARSGSSARKVTLQGRDVYGLTAELLATAAVRMCEADFDQKGVVSPVQAVGLDRLQKVLIDNDVSIQTFD
jgi:short subunit dehydrogenase-like uncharacterized protein